MTNFVGQGDDLLGLRTDTVTADGKIHFHADGVDFDYHITALPGYDPVVMRAMLEVIRRLGLELMDEDECEPEILDGGAVRLHLTPIVPPPVEALVIGDRILVPFTLPSLEVLIPNQSPNRMEVSSTC